MKVCSIDQCFLIRVLQNPRDLQNIVRGSSSNCGISVVLPSEKEQRGKYSSWKWCPYLQVKFRE
jgi:hypothetical protein